MSFQLSYRSNSQRGFSMLEVLVTLIIIALALLGTAGLQLYAMKVSKNSEFLTQAIFLASDLAERMEANPKLASQGGYEVAKTNTPRSVGFNCTAACNPEQLKEWDLAEWEKTIVEKLPEAKWEVRYFDDPQSKYEIELSWRERDLKKRDENNKNGMRFTYVARRYVRYVPE